MAQKLEKWIETHVEKFEKYNVETLSNIMFFREEPRPVFINPKYFYSPCDGIVLYNKIVKPDENLIEVKGQNYNLNDLVQNQVKFDSECLVIGIFMTFYDVHVNRIPYQGLLRYKALDSIKSYNMPMIFTEKGIFDGDSHYALSNATNYLKNNERMLNIVQNIQKNYTYYMVQIADEDVDVITHFATDQNTYYAQNDRFSFIRWGSQVDLILPLNKGLEFKTLVDPFYHVKAVEDKLVEIL